MLIYQLLTFSIRLITTCFDLEKDRGSQDRKTPNRRIKNAIKSIE
jgi:hypothetical protein